MRVVVVGATGNVGTSVLTALAGEASVSSIVGLARRRPKVDFAKTQFVSADIETAELAPLFDAADAVVHLAWRIQPSRDLNALWRTNVEGSSRVFEAAVRAGVPALVYGSSVGVYSPGPKDRRVDESWNRDGVPSSFYARHKAEVERRLDRLQREHPGVRVVRLRPALVFKRDAAAGIRRLFAGPFVPTPLLRASLTPFVPDVPGLRFQAVHGDDVGEAYRAAVTREVSGPFNIAAEPVLDSPRLAELAQARSVRVPASVLRTAAAITWRLRLQPSPPGWIDLAFGVPLMDTSRAERELGWRPRRGADEALVELLHGMRQGAGIPTPPLDPASSGPLRTREIATRVGGRDDA